jgi:hypothetical protein
VTVPLRKALACRRRANHPRIKASEAASAFEKVSALLKLELLVAVDYTNLSTWKSALRKDYPGSNNVSACETKYLPEIDRSQEWKRIYS